MIIDRFLMLLMSCAIAFSSASAIADTGIRTSRSYSVEFDTNVKQAESNSTLPADREEDFKVLFYRGGTALLIDPRSFIKQGDDIDQQLKQLETTGAGYYLCTRKERTTASDIRHGRTYSTDLDSMRRNGYQCDRHND